MANKVDDIESSIIELLAARVPAGRRVSMQAQIVRDLGLDSAAIMDFVMDLEERFGISIPLDQIAEVETVEDLRRAVESLMRNTT